ncbi:MAG: zf-TFIIB domain-containing protein [Pirellulaceae bacterium]|nr:zf-TFIIB domain-containing protein [Pirellulaceae bacterium]
MARRSPHDGVDESTTRVVLCMQCGQPTIPKQYAVDSAIVIDECSQCELVYLDPGELENMQMYVEGIDLLVLKPR